MQKTGFTEALDQLVTADPRYDREAYLFLQDALDFTMKSRKKQKTDLSRHVTGQELLEGVRAFALREYGPMVTMVFETWGISRCEDFGEMVFNLIHAGIFGKTDTDTIDDFHGGYNFHEAFIKPFQPEGQATAPGASADGTGGKAGGGNAGGDSPRQPGQPGQPLRQS
ncbi:MAG: hypothetical protein PHQ12_06505 [Chthoniobacteraceae bacterium]|nr:hypothetical protein [Chthoniobacteraceae bacterium]